MRFLSLAWAALWRTPTRTVLTIASLAVGFLLFGLLQGVNSTFTRAIGRTKADRLLIDARFDARLPLSYADRIARVPGVREVAWTQFISGFYQDPKNGVLILTTDAARFYKVRDEYVTSPAALAALARTRTGLIVLDTLARKYGWRIGQRVTVQSPVEQKSGSHAWDFDIVGIMTCPNNPGQFPFAVANYTYLDEARVADKGTVGRFLVRVSDPRHSVDVGRAIDAAFINSPVPTLTQLENAFAGAELATIGDVGRLTVAVISAVLFAILFLAGNVILQSVRERTAEFAVLKTIGFSDTRVLGLVALEALLLCSTGAVIGLAVSAAVFPLMNGYLTSLSLYLSTPGLAPSVLLLGLAFAAALSILAGALPAWSAMRLDIVGALRSRA